jgi:hypothetical protein
VRRGGPHFISDAKVFYLGSYFGDDAGDIEAEDPGEFQMDDVTLSAAADFPIDGVDGGGADANTDVAGPEVWGRDVVDLEDRGVAIAVNADGFHGCDDGRLQERGRKGNVCLAETLGEAQFSIYRGSLGGRRPLRGPTQQDPLRAPEKFGLLTLAGA